MCPSAKFSEILITLGPSMFFKMDWCQTDVARLNYTKEVKVAVLQKQIIGLQIQTPCEQASIFGRNVICRVKYWPREHITSKISLLLFSGFHSY